MKLAVIEQGVLRGGGGVPKAVADVEAERHAVRFARGAAPVPGVAVGPDAPAPVEHGEGRVRLESVAPAAHRDRAGSAHAVYLLVVVEVRLFAEGRTHDNALFRLVGEQNLALYGQVAREAGHSKTEHSPARHMPEGDGIAPALDLYVPARGALRHAPAAHRQGADGRERVLPEVFEVNEAYRIQAHVAVIGDGKRHGPAAVVHEVVVPLLEAQRPGLDGLTGVGGQQFAGKAGLCYVPVCVQKRPRAGYLVLHHSPRSFLIRRISLPTKVSSSNSPARREAICPP